MRRMPVTEDVFLRDRNLECTYSFPLIVDPQPHASDMLHNTQPSSCELACISSCNPSSQLKTQCPPGGHVCGDTQFRAASHTLTATEPRKRSSCTAHIVVGKHTYSDQGERPSGFHNLSYEWRSPTSTACGKSCPAELGWTLKTGRPMSSH